MESTKFSGAAFRIPVLSLQGKWTTLNGEWGFAFSDDNRGLLEMVQTKDYRPFAYQSSLSGIHTTEIHPVVWYQRDFAVPEDWDGERVTITSTPWTTPWCG